MTPRGGRHPDLGLQPERTWLAWRRTLLSLVGASLLFLRWVPHHGAFALLMVSVALLAAIGIGLDQKHGYRRGVAAMNGGSAEPPLWSVIALAVACALLGLLGIYVVAFF